MNPYHHINALSLDVVAGAIAGCLFFGHLFDTSLPIEVLITLGLAVWAVYTLDHLWDAHRSSEPSGSLRHRLHRQHFVAFSTAALLALLIGFMLTFYLPITTRNFGLCLVIAVVIYFLTIQPWYKHKLYHKELLVAIIYTLGVSVGPWSLNSDSIDSLQLLILFQFAALAFANLALFACFELDTDRVQNFNSLAITIGKKPTLRIIGLVLTLILASSIFGVLSSSEEVVRECELIIILMTISLLILLKFQGYFKSNDRYRLIGDAIFFIPLLVL